MFLGESTFFCLWTLKVEIQAFVPEPYWRLVATFPAGLFQSRMFQKVESKPGFECQGIWKVVTIWTSQISEEMHHLIPCYTKAPKLRNLQGKQCCKHMVRWARSGTKERPFWKLTCSFTQSISIPTWSCRGFTFQSWSFLGSAFKTRWKPRTRMFTRLSKMDQLQWNHCAFVSFFSAVFFVVWDSRRL